MKRVWVVLLLLGGLAPACGLASLSMAMSGSTPAIESAHDAARYERLLQVSGMDQEIVDVPESMAQSLVNQVRSTQADPAIVSAFQARAEQVFDPVRFRAHMLAYLQASVSTSDADTVIAWLQTPLGQEMTALEVAANTPAGAQGMAQAKAHPPALTPEREQVLRELDRVSESSEVMVRLAESMTLMRVRAVAARVPDKRDALLAQAQASLAAAHDKVLASAQQQTLISLAYVYRDVPQDKLEDYLRFEQTSPARHFNMASNAGFLQALEAATRELLAIPGR